MIKKTLKNEPDLKTFVSKNFSPEQLSKFNNSPLPILTFPCLIVYQENEFPEGLYATVKDLLELQVQALTILPSKVMVMSVVSLNSINNATLDIVTKSLTKNRLSALILLS